MIYDDSTEEFHQEFHQTGRSRHAKTVLFEEVPGVVRVARREQVRLGTTQEEAFQRWEELRQEPVSASVPAVVLIDRYLDWLQRNRSPATYDWYLIHLQRFATHLGKKTTVSQVRPHHVTEWVSKHPTWSVSTVSRVMKAVQRTFNWAVKEGYLLRSPVANLEIPAPKPRETVIPPNVWQQMLADATDEAERDLLVVLRETGCRVQEIRIVEARHFEEPQGRWVFELRESKGKRRQRVVYLTNAALDIVRRLVAKHPTGPIFRNHHGKPWTRNAIRCRFRKFKKYLPKLCGTVIRHTYTTEALKAGTNPVVLAELLGHSGIETLAKNYAHLFKSPEFLREQAEKARAH